MNFSTLEITRDNTICTLWLNRPQQHNTINEIVARELAQVMYALERDSSVRAIILRGRGKIFSAGGDITMFKENLDNIAPFMNGVIASFHEAVLTMRRMDKPIISALEGSCAGGGLSLALAADFILAEEKTKFAVAYRKIGASTDGGMTHLLSRLIGQRKVIELLLLSDFFTARQALDHGLVNWVEPQENFEKHLQNLALSLAENAPLVTKKVKSLVYNAPTNTYPEQLIAEQEAFADVATSDDFIEGIKAFFEKRKPRFTGH